MCMEVTGGRKWAELGVSNNLIKDVIADLASNLAEDLNKACQEGIVWCEQRLLKQEQSDKTICQETLVKCKHVKQEVVVQIGGSVRVMELNSDKFLAGDIDLDWYDLSPEHQPKMPEEETTIKETLFIKCCGEFRKKKIYKKDFGKYSYEAKKDPRNLAIENNIRYMKLPVKIIQGTNEKNVEITAELKNVTSQIWHQGYKKGKRREINGLRSIWIPDEQLYLDICMRLCETKEKSKAVSIDVLEQEVTLAVENKGLFIKKEIMEQCVSKDRIMQLAKDKLEADWYAIFCQVIECKTCEDFVAVCRKK